MRESDMALKQIPDLPPAYSNRAVESTIFREIFTLEIRPRNKSLAILEVRKHALPGPTFVANFSSPPLTRTRLADDSQIAKNSHSLIFSCTSNPHLVIDC